MDRNPPASARPWVLAGGALFLGTAAVVFLANGFTYGTDMSTRPILPLVAVMGAMGAGYLGFFAHLARSGALDSAPAAGVAWGLFACGAMMRLIMSFSQPILEDDWYRYLWDGAVTAHGHNPYAVIPASALEAENNGVRELAQEAGILWERINHPNLGTVYPPLAQGAFAVAHGLAPWRLSGLRVLYFVVDCAVFALLIALLRALGKSPLYVALYWWNPLLIKECYNSVHMDVLVLPFMLGALLLHFRQRPARAAALLAAAAAVKVWPVLFVPPLLAAYRNAPRRVALAAAVFLATATLLFLPTLSAYALGDRSGFLAYSGRWEMNDALFMLFPKLVEWTATLFGGEASAAFSHRGGRIIAAGIVAAASILAGLWVARQSPGAWTDQAWRRTSVTAWGGIVAVLFLVSPTQFPWYFIWLLPFLALAPRPSLLLLTALLPIYYLKFYFEARGAVDFFHYRIVWLEHGPVLALLVWEGLHYRKRNARATRRDPGLHGKP